MLKTTPLVIEVKTKHHQYGVRCGYCNFKWPCEAMRLVLENEELQSQIVVLKAEYSKLKYGARS